MVYRVAALVISVVLVSANALAATQTKKQEEDSVYRWGRWATLSPAAGGEPVTTPLQLVQFNNHDVVPIPEPEPTPTPNPPTPLSGPCNTDPCGFARIGTRTNGFGANETGVFDLVQNVGAGTASFGVNPTQSAAIVSGPVAVDYLPNSFNPVTVPNPGDTYVRGVVLNSDANGPTVVFGDWAQNGDTGYYIWGVPASTSELDGLMQGNVIAEYAGSMLNGGAAALTLNFGAQSWTGQFTGGAVDFSATGDIQGGALNSTGFSANIDAANSFVQGGVVNHGDNVIGRFEVSAPNNETAYSDIFKTDRQLAQ